MRPAWVARLPASMAPASSARWRVDVIAILGNRPLGSTVTHLLMTRAQKHCMLLGKRGSFFEDFCDLTKIIIWRLDQNYPDYMLHDSAESTRLRKDNRVFIGQVAYRYNPHIDYVGRETSLQKNKYF